MKEDIKAILKDFYRSKPENTDVHCQLVGNCAPDIPSSYVSAVLKEFATGEFNLETLEASAERIVSYKPEQKKKEKHQIAED